MEFPRGDGVTHFFYIPQANWSAGGKLFFAAKPVVDDDSTDAAAVINQSWSDSAVTQNVTVNGVVYAKYTCYFPPSATNSIVSNGAQSADYLGEFQWVPNGGDPVTFPANDPKIDCRVYFDIKRKTTP